MPSLAHPAGQNPVHRGRVVPVVVAERVLEVRRADRVVSAPDAILQQAPEPLQRVRVDVPGHIDLCRVVDPSDAIRVPPAPSSSVAFPCKLPVWAPALPPP